jgi:hypothetical protein
MKIYTNNEYELFKDVFIENTYKIEFKKESKSLLKSILKTNILVGSSVSNEYKTLHLKATSIIPLLSKHNEYSYETCLKFMYCLSKQLEFLIETERKCFYKLIPSNIFLIDDSKFIYLSNEYLSDIEDNMLFISTPFQKEDLLDSPELLELHTIPAKIHYKTIYYTLANLVIFFLERKDTDKNVLEGTKLLAMLKRCFHMVPEKRSILFV